ncbi:hypothetical protein [Bradyrhizobium sp. WSM3983]|uniref:hypothetical protein n=1 Tax=Bradyrhizobium sp. WSM3983 TaxID=1038867 RepID=UPI0012EC8D33|nr:hypothetical protein [Bradyrhizobium sp. WSM3983]
MTDQPINEALEQKKARLAQQAAAIARELQELEEIQRLTALAAKHNLVVSAAPAPPKSGEKVGSCADLIDRYCADPRSNYHQLRYKVRRNYTNIMRRIAEDVVLGIEPIADLNAAKVQAAYERWSEGGRLAQGHSLIRQLRLLCTYGVTVLNDDACVRLSAVLHKMRVRKPRGGAVLLTEEHVRLIRAKAHEMKLPSVALAQAIQFECRLKQTDVIGEWVPVSEPGVSDIVSENKGKWLRGIRWEEIDSKMILRHISSLHQRDIVIDLNKSPMVMEELSKIGKLPARGPIIVNEITGVPWAQFEFRRRWRKIANAVGVPENVKNGNSSLGEASNESRSPDVPAQEVGMA